jgi:hypothetical protein
MIDDLSVLFVDEDCGRFHALVFRRSAPPAMSGVERGDSVSFTHQHRHVLIK